MAAPSAPAVFPQLKARNLNGRRLTLPAGFAGVRNIVIVAFRRWHQPLVDSWFPALDPLLAAHPDLRAYELPVIASGYGLVRPFIDGGMAVAIPDPAVRERTLTVYTDVATVMAALQIANPETITILLVDLSGQISWRSEGAHDPEKGAGLAQELAAGSR
ncbi:MAG: hypothetical protein HGA45_26920 [Chloroflexales bacterium]|nr:hypothetical protein [Chloroflexales bacterium]